MADLQRYAEAADIVGCDIYPVPVKHSPGHSDLANRQLSCVGDYTERFRQAGGRRPVWMVLQGFGWRDIQQPAEDAPAEEGRRPTQSESRFMLYDAIVHAREASSIGAASMLRPLLISGTVFAPSWRRLPRWKTSGQPPMPSPSR